MKLDYLPPHPRESTFKEGGGMGAPPTLHVAVIGSSFYPRPFRPAKKSKLRVGAVVRSYEKIALWGHVGGL